MNNMKIQKDEEKVSGQGQFLVRVYCLTHEFWNITVKSYFRFLLIIVYDQITKLKHRKNKTKEEDQTNQPFESIDPLQEVKV